MFFEAEDRTEGIGSCTGGLDAATGTRAEPLLRFFVEAEAATLGVVGNGAALCTDAESCGSGSRRVAWAIALVFGPNVCTRVALAASDSVVAPGRFDEA